MSSKKGVLTALVYVTTLFFAWGFVTSVIDPLVASVRGVFSLNYTEAMLTQFAWFIAYGVVSLPAAAILSKLGYSSSIVTALTTMLIGCLMIPVATHMDFYPGVLLALFVIASGVTLLQVAANPLVAALGDPKTSHFRLTFSQAFNSFGTWLGPLVGSTIMLSSGVFSGEGGDHAANRAESLRAIDINFLGIGAFFAVLAFFIWTVRKRITAAAGASEATLSSPLAAFKSPWAVWGGVAIFLYVGSEVAIGSLLTNYLHSDGIFAIPLEDAGRMVAFYWGGAMVGRFIGSAILTRVPAGVVLGAATIIAATACLVLTQISGPNAGYLALSIGFFNSIMFPTIFTLTLERSTAPVSSTSGLLCMSIVGGAVLPLIAGHIIDISGFGPAFFVPMLGYLGIAVFAIAAARAKGTAAAAPVVAGH